MGSILRYIKQVLTDRKTRLVQLGSRIFAKALMAIAGGVGVTDPDTHMVGGVADAVAIAAFALVMFGIDLVIHKLRHGGVVRDTPATKP